MPRTRRRSPQQGQPGQAYPNRSDLAQAPRAAPGQQYGKATEQIEAQKAVPMAGAPVAAGAPPPQAGPAFIPPDQTPTFGQPSSRPDEPLTAGLPFGPGRNPGPHEAQLSGVSDDITDQLRALYAQFPTPEIRELLEQGG